MAKIPRIDTNFQSSLASKISDVATSFALTRSTDDDGTTLAGTWLLTFDEGTSKEEHMLVTLAGSAGTIVTGGLSRVDMQSLKTGNRFDHDKQASVKVTDAPIVLIQRALNGVDAFDTVDWTGVNSISGLALPTAGELTKACTVEYANNLALAGVADASLVSKGIVEIATQTEVDDGDDTGSTSAYTVVTPSTFLEAQDRVVTNDFTYGATIAVRDALYYDTATSKLKLADATTSATSTNFVGFALDSGVDTDTSKKVQIAGIVAGFTGLTEGVDYYLTNTPGAISDTPGTYLRPIGRARSTTTIQILPSFPIEYLEGRNSDASTANFNEAMTFFANTDLSGAEAETLSDGSDADTLHIHGINDFFIGVGKMGARTYDNFIIGFYESPADDEVWDYNAAAGYNGKGHGSWFDGTASGGANNHTMITVAGVYFDPDGTNGQLRFSNTNKLIVEFRCNLSAVGSNQAGFGLMNSTAPIIDYDDDTTDACCFTIDASGNLYGHTSTGAGGGAHTETAITGITLTNLNTYRIEWDPASEARFYVNGVLKATVTTTLPDGGTINFGFGGASIGTDRVDFITAPKFRIEL